LRGLRTWVAWPDRIPISPTWRLRLAWVVVILSIVGWPLSALTWARDEPQFVLGLSWLAITLTALDILSTSDVRVEQDGTTKAARR
jgi:hypothetical protein